RKTLDVRNVAGGELEIRLDCLAVDDQRIGPAELVELAGKHLGLAVIHGRLVEDDDAAVLRLRRKSMAKRQSPYLLRQVDRVAANQRTEHATPAQGRADALGAVASATGALPAVHIRAGAAHC